MAQTTIGAKLVAALITGGSVLGIAATSGTIPWLGQNNAPASIAALPQPESLPEPIVADVPQQEPVPAIEQPATVQELEPEVETALVVPQSPILTGPPSLDVDPPSEAAELVIPGFDLLRVEPNGSVLIAGTAAPNATVEAITGSRILGSAKAAANGDFVIVFDQELAPGNYNIVLRADDKEGTAATSLQTAIVSIPEQGSDGILALVEEPGAPSRLISTGQGTAQPLVAATELEELEQPTAASEVASEDATPIDEPTEEIAVVQSEPTAEAAPTPAPAPTQTFDVRIEAVEIDGSTVFVAGQADPNARLRVYANDLLLGETTANPDGTFLVQVNRDLPVGDYMVRADLLSANGADVVMRAAVPFVREPGEKLAAVAVPPSLGLPSNPPAISGTENRQTTPQETETPSVENTSADAADVETQVQQPLKSADGSVIIRRGDTLWQISRRVYGRGIKYTTIYNANVEQIRDPNRIWPGQIFAVPETPEPELGDATTVN